MTIQTQAFHVFSSRDNRTTFLIQFLCHKVPFAIDALNDFIFVVTYKGAFFSVVKEAAFGNKAQGFIFHVFRS